MQDLYLFIGWALFILLILFAISGFLYILNAFKKNILVSYMGIAQWTFSIILSLIFAFADIDKFDLIYAIPILFVLSFTKIGYIVAYITSLILSIFINVENILPIDQIQNERYKIEIMWKYCYELYYNIKKVIETQMAYKRYKINDIEGVFFSIFVISAFYVLIIKKASSPIQEINTFSKEILTYFLNEMYQMIKDKKRTKEELNKEIDKFKEEYDYLIKLRPIQYISALQRDLHPETIYSQLIGIFAENYFIEPINEDEKKTFIVNIAIPMSQSINKLISEMK
ncbi:MAG: hypothetical protein M1438_16790 [Deltaproteobacteria bacterium]|nr:hypothetical protein [Deltaproteobacteria bacterium]